MLSRHDTDVAHTSNGPVHLNAYSPRLRIFAGNPPELNVRFAGERMARVKSVVLCWSTEHLWGLVSSARHDACILLVARMFFPQFMIVRGAAERVITEHVDRVVWLSSRSCHDTLYSDFL